MKVGTIEKTVRSHGREWLGELSVVVCPDCGTVLDSTVPDSYDYFGEPKYKEEDGLIYQYRTVHVNCECKCGCNFSSTYVRDKVFSISNFMATVLAFGFLGGLIGGIGTLVCGLLIPALILFGIMIVSFLILGLWLGFEEEDEN